MAEVLIALFTCRLVEIVSAVFTAADALRGGCPPKLEPGSGERDQFAPDSEPARILLPENFGHYYRTRACCHFTELLCQSSSPARSD